MSKRPKHGGPRKNTAEDAQQPVASLVSVVVADRTVVEEDLCVLSPFLRWPELPKWRDRLGCLCPDAACIIRIVSADRACRFPCACAPSTATIERERLKAAVERLTATAATTATPGWKLLCGTHQVAPLTLSRDALPAPLLRLFAPHNGVRVDSGPVCGSLSTATRAGGLGKETCADVTTPSVRGNGSKRKRPTEAHAPPPLSATSVLPTMPAMVNQHLLPSDEHCSEADEVFVELVPALEELESVHVAPGAVASEVFIVSHVAPSIALLHARPPVVETPDAADVSPLLPEAPPGRPASSVALETKAWPALSAAVSVSCGVNIAPTSGPSAAAVTVVPAADADAFSIALSQLILQLPDTVDSTDTRYSLDALRTRLSKVSISASATDEELSAFQDERRYYLRTGTNLLEQFKKLRVDANLAALTQKIHRSLCGLFGFYFPMGLAPVADAPSTMAPLMLALQWAGTACCPDFFRLPDNDLKVAYVKITGDLGSPIDKAAALAALAPTMEGWVLTRAVQLVDFHKSLIVEQLNALAACKITFP